MRIKKDESALLVIDFQEKLFPHIYEYEELESNVLKLIKGIKALNLPILVTEQYRKGLGPTVDSILKELDTDNPIEKMHFSCCGSDEYMQEQKKAGRKNIIITGIEAHVCVLQTVIDLIEKGFQPVVVEDCVSSRRFNDKMIAIERMLQEGAIVTTYESILFELTEISGTPVFKEISKIVK